MNDQAEPAQKSGATQTIAIQLPTRIVERAEKYAKKNGDTIAGVVIEALDAFLRGQEGH